MEIALNAERHSNILVIFDAVKTCFIIMLFPFPESCYHF